MEKGFGVEGLPLSLIHGEFQDSLGFLKPCLKTNKQQKNLSFICPVRPYCVKRTSYKAIDSSKEAWLVLLFLVDCSLRCWKHLGKWDLMSFLWGIQKASEAVTHLVAYTRFWIQFLAHIHHFKTSGVEARGLQIQSLPTEWVWGQPVLRPSLIKNN